MKMTKAFAPWVAIFFGVSLLAYLFLQPLSAFSQEEMGEETAVTQPPAPPVNNPKIEAQLLTQLAEAEPDASIRYIVYMAAPAASKQAVEQIADEETRRAVLVDTLQKTAGQSQENLLNEVNALQQTGAVQSYRSLWIINAVAVEGTVESIAELANRADVALITRDEAHPLIAPPAMAEQLELMWQVAATAAAGEEPWGIDRVRSPYAWQGLGVDGNGVTVGIMDSGVDWQHPDLQQNYRGNVGGGTYEHAGNWFDVVVPTMTVPYDDLGHGTHVAGTAIGQNGIGVAPGASWVAVKIADANGLIYESDAHVGFQWLLAPDGDPSLAPDVINGSWSGSGYSEAFLPDIEALDTAGIITVFSAGNSGPDEETIGAPASYRQTLAVGAHDDANILAWFSSRGPSPLHTEIHPQITAPGARVYSSLPGGIYGYYNGTSMAAPHTTGAVALLLSVDDTLSRQDVTRILTETAVPMAAVQPNMDSGWGRLDVYGAAAQVAAHGTLTGIVHENGQPQAGVSITITTSLGDALVFVTDENGAYAARLQAGSYTLSTAPFGFMPVTVSNLALLTDNTTTQDISLTRLASGTLALQVVKKGTNVPVQATIDILDTPLSLETAVNGSLTVPLPAGAYELRVRETGYTISRTNITISQNQTSTHKIALTPGKKVLLVDTGAWYYRSYGSYFAESLTQLNYAFDSLVITSPISPAFPEQAVIDAYDVLVWSSPSDSPGYIGANDVITDFLGQGGNLFISGQSMGTYDGYGFYTQDWWYRDLQADLMGKTAVTHTITGAPFTTYEGLTITLNGESSAQNQSGIDSAQPRKNSLTQEIFHTDTGAPVGLQAGHCKPFRMSYLGFGLEGVSEADARDEILAQSFAYFDTPRQQVGLLWRPEAIDELAPPGEALVYPIQMQHLSELITDTYSLRIDDSLWPVSLNTTKVTLGPCKSNLITVTVQVPANLPRDLDHDFLVTAVSQKDPSVQVSLPVHHKTPGNILLVDDDRWYNQEEIYRAALTDAGFIFDEWNIGWDNNIKGTPPLSLLNAYNYVIWFNGYDWFQPLSPQENKTVSAYLGKGGRLFLSSQDFLYYHANTPLAQNQLGIIEYEESISPTTIYRGHPIIPTNFNEPLALTFGNFRNNSDGLIPNSSAVPFLWHNRGMAAGVANSIPAAGSPQKPDLSRTVFFGFPFEKLPQENRANLMSSILGWLTDVGDSTFEVDQRSGTPHDARTYTITLRNHPLAQTSQIFMTNTLPISLTLQPASLTGGAIYGLGSRQIFWRGSLASGEEHIITYRATPAHSLSDGDSIDNLLTIGFENHALEFDQTTSFWINTPDLSSSTLMADHSLEDSTHHISYTLSLQNSDVRQAEQVTATLRTSRYLTIDGYTTSNQSGQLSKSGTTFVWTGTLLPNEHMTITVTANRPMKTTEPEWVTAVAYLQDGSTSPLVKAVYTHLPPHKYYYPIVFQNE
ncbi:MAG: S8 family serine peptidase [Anaerolineae bacterium]|nr:S8 family serine peptidase [Anaerolineae bacterium]